MVWRAAERFFFFFLGPLIVTNLLEARTVSKLCPGASPHFGRREYLTCCLISLLSARAPPCAVAAMVEIGIGGTIDGSLLLFRRSDFRAVLTIAHLSKDRHKPLQYKLKTTEPESFSVHVPEGSVLPGQTATVSIDIRLRAKPGQRPDDSFSLGACLFLLEIFSGTVVLRSQTFSCRWHPEEEGSAETVAPPGITAMPQGKSMQQQQQQQQLLLLLRSVSQGLFTFLFSNAHMLPIGVGLLWILMLDIQRPVVAFLVGVCVTLLSHIFR